MKNEIWIQPELDLTLDLKKHRYDEIKEYVEENRRMVLSSWKTDEIDKLKKSLRFGSSLLSFQADRLQKDRRLFAVFKMGELSGTIDALNKLIYEKEQIKKVSEDFQREYKHIKHLTEIVVLLNLYGSLTHSEICEKLQFNAPTLTEIIKKIMPTKTINVTSAGKYKLYSLTDKGRKLVIYLRESNIQKDQLETILSQLKEYAQQTKEFERIKKELKTFFEEIDAVSISKGDSLSIDFCDNLYSSFSHIDIKIADIRCNENSEVQISGVLNEHGYVCPHFINLLKNRKEI